LYADGVEMRRRGPHATAHFDCGPSKERWGLRSMCLLMGQQTLPA